MTDWITGIVQLWLASTGLFAPGEFAKFIVQPILTSCIFLQSELVSIDFKCNVINKLKKILSLVNTLKCVFRLVFKRFPGIPITLNQVQYLCSIACLEQPPKGPIGRIRFKIDYEKKFPILSKLPFEILQELGNHKYGLKISTLMKVNKYCFEVFSPLIYHSIHSIIPIISPDDDPCPDREALYVLDNQIFSNIVPENAQINVVIGDDQKHFNYEGLKILSKEERNETWRKKVNGKFEILHIIPDLSSDRYHPCPSTTFIQDHTAIRRLCQNVVNNEKSVMRKFIKHLSIHIFFLDRELPESSFAESIFSNVLVQESGVAAYKLPQPIFPGALKLFNGFNVMRICMGLRYQEKKDTKRKQLQMVQRLSPCELYDFDDTRQIPRKELVGLSRLFYGRHELANASSEEEARLTVKKIFIDLSLESFNKESSTDSLVRITHRELEGLTIGTSSFIDSDDEMFDFFQDIIQATLANPIRETSTSLVWMSAHEVQYTDDIYRNHEGRNILQFPKVEPSITVINSPPGSTHST